MDMAQMFLHRLSKLLVVCWMESHSVSLAHASESCSRTSQMLNTDSTPAVCCSMSLCRSCHQQKNSVSGRKRAWLHLSHALQNAAEGGERTTPMSGKAHLALENSCRMNWADDTDQERTTMQNKKESQSKLSLLINSLDNFNVHSKSKPHLYHV